MDVIINICYNDEIRLIHLDKLPSNYNDLSELFNKTFNELLKDIKYFHFETNDGDWIQNDDDWNIYNEYLLITNNIDNMDDNNEDIDLNKNNNNNDKLYIEFSLTFIKDTNDETIHSCSYINPATYINKNNQPKAYNPYLMTKYSFNNNNNSC